MALWEVEDQVHRAVTVLNTMYSSRPDSMSRKKSLVEKLFLSEKPSYLHLDVAR